LSKNFVIVGGGPVGLWTAIQLRKRFPNSSVFIYERYQEYKRKHVLKIQHSSMFFGACRQHDELDAKFFEAVFEQSRGKTKYTPLAKSFISTSSIESNLKQWALSAGVEIQYETIETLDDLVTRNPDSEFILANGAHSSLRTQLLGDDDIEKSDLQHILELKTRVGKSLSQLRSTRANGAVKGRLKHLGFEYIGREDNAMTPLSFRLFVDQQTYSQVPEASFKSPITSPDVLPDCVQEDLSMYAQLHDFNLETLFEHGQVSKLQLSVYHAKAFAATYRDHNFYLVGDCAMGVPYFRALNCGLVLGSRLTSILHHRSPVAMYNRYKPVHQYAESMLAKSKNTALNSYDELRKLYRRENVKRLGLVND